MVGGRGEGYEGGWWEGIRWKCEGCRENLFFRTRFQMLKVFLSNFCDSLLYQCFHMTNGWEYFQTGINPNINPRPFCCTSKYLSCLSPQSINAVLMTFDLYIVKSFKGESELLLQLHRQSTRLRRFKQKNHQNCTHYLNQPSVAVVTVLTEGRGQRSWPGSKGQQS